MALADFQFSLGGVVFGTGTIYLIEDVTGLGLGDKREKVFANPGADGVAWGREYRNGPTITFTGQVVCERDPAAAYSGMLALRSAFDGSNRTGTKTSQVLGIKMPGQVEGAIAGRPGRFDPVMSQLAIGIIPFAATFVAAGPLDV